MGKFVGDFFLEIGEILGLIAAVIGFFKSIRTAKPGVQFLGFNGKG